MGFNSELIFHAPYLLDKNGKAECLSNQDAGPLLDYYQEMLGKESGSLLFERTMSYCGQDTGWVINKDAAKLYNISN